MPDDATRRTQLLEWLAGSQRVQRNFKLIGRAGVVAVLGLIIAGFGAGVVAGAVGLTAIVAGCGIWITYGHIEDFKRQLARLDGDRRTR